MNILPTSWGVASLFQRKQRSEFIFNAGVQNAVTNTLWRYATCNPELTFKNNTCRITKHLKLMRIQKKGLNVLHESFKFQPFQGDERGPTSQLTTFAWCRVTPWWVERVVAVSPKGWVFSLPACVNRHFCGCVSFTCFQWKHVYKRISYILESSVRSWERRNI